MTQAPATEREIAGISPDVPLRHRALGRLCRTARSVPLHVLLAMALLLVLAVLAVAAPLIAPHDPIAPDFGSALRPPLGFESADLRYLLGTDQLGRDILSRIIYGARVSMIVGLSGVGVAAFLGISLGLIAGYYGGLMDDALMRVADVQLSFPAVILAIIVVTTLGIGMTNVILVLGIIAWPPFARLARGATLAERQKQYVDVAVVLGCRDLRIMFRHILPNLASPLLVMAAFTMAQMILWESALSFLGLGVPPPAASWGNMLADARGQIATAWWMAIIPGLAIAATIFAINVVQEWLRDRVTGLDP